MTADKQHVKPSCYRKKNGAVLLGVLGIILLISVIVTLYLESVMTSIRHNTNSDSRQDMRTEALNVLNITLATMRAFETADKAFYSYRQGWTRPLDYVPEYLPPPGLQVKVTIHDETAKLPLNRLNEQQLHFLFEELGFESGDQDELTDCLLDWIDADELKRINGAEKDDYEREYGKEILPSNGIIVSWDEFRLIKGFRENFFDPNGLPNDKMKALKAACSIYHGFPINVNGANELALQSMAKSLNFEADAMLDYIKGPDGIYGTEDDRHFDATVTNPYLPRGSARSFDNRSRLFIIEIEIGEGQRSYRLFAMLAVDSRGNGLTTQTQQGRNTQTTQSGTTNTAQTATDLNETNTYEQNLMSKEQALQIPYRILRLEENLDF